MILYPLILPTAHRKWVQLQLHMRVKSVIKKKKLQTWWTREANHHVEGFGIDVCMTKYLAYWKYISMGFSVLYFICSNNTVASMGLYVAFVEGLNIKKYIQKWKYFKAFLNPYSVNYTKLTKRCSLWIQLYSIFRLKLTFCHFNQMFYQKIYQTCILSYVRLGKSLTTIMLY